LIVDLLVHSELSLNTRPDSDWSPLSTSVA